MLDLTGWDFAMSLRALLPERGQEEFDGMLDLYADAPGEVEACGAYSSLSAAFRWAVRVRDEATVAALLRQAEDVMATCEGRLDEPAVDRLHNAVVTCFLETVLPVEEDRFAMVAPHMGPATLRWAEQWQQWWLEPEPRSAS